MVKCSVCLRFLKHQMKKKCHCLQRSLGNSSLFISFASNALFLDLRVLPEGL